MLTINLSSLIFTIGSFKENKSDYMKDGVLKKLENYAGLCYVGKLCRKSLRVDLSLRGSSLSSESNLKFKNMLRSKSIQLQDVMRKPA